MFFESDVEICTSVKDCKAVANIFLFFSKLFFFFNLCTCVLFADDGEEKKGMYKTLCINCCHPRPQVFHEDSRQSELVQPVYLGFNNNNKKKEKSAARSSVNLCLDVCFFRKSEKY